MIFGAVPSRAQTIENIANAEWTVSGMEYSTTSNRVVFDVAMPAATISTYQPVVADGRSTQIVASRCGNQPITTASVDPRQILNWSISPTTTIKVGRIVVFEVVAPIANTDPDARDQLTAVLNAPSGDAETLTIYETEVDSGIFIGELPTRRIPPAPVSGDCVLSLAGGETITIDVNSPGSDEVLVSAKVLGLADPYGMVFDSADGTPVDGARVTLIDTTTGLPAEVFSEDGVTPYPSTVISGTNAVDNAGLVYPVEAGEFRFPLTPAGSYRLLVEPPEPFTAPSVVPESQLATLTRPGGGSFIITDASYGNPFALSGNDAVQIDIPVDLPGLPLLLDKRASRERAQPGDVVFYTVTVRNPDELRSRQDVVFIDLPSTWLRLRPDSIRLNGEDPGDALTIASDGKRFEIVLGAMTAGQSHRITYAMTVRPDASPGQAGNRAEVIDITGGISRAGATVRIDRDLIAGRMTLIGRVTAGGCGSSGEAIGIPGVRVMLEDGSFAVTDADGRYHFDGLVPGAHVVQAQNATLPEGGEFVDCAPSTRSAGRANSRFITGQGGSLVVADFHAVIPEGALLVDAASTRAEPLPDPVAAGAETNWIAMGNGPNDWLFPAIDHNPRSPAIRVAIRHRPTQSVVLKVDGEPIADLSFEGTDTAPSRDYAVSLWRGVQLEGETTRLVAEIREADGSLVETLEREVYFVNRPARVELLPEASNLVADGRSRPVLAVRLTDRHGRPVHAGLTGQLTINSPYESARAIEVSQSRALGGLGSVAPTWLVEGDDGIAYIELAPTMVSGAVRAEFSFLDGETRHTQTLESWMVPGDQEWTIIGLAEGSVGAQSIADEMERAGSFDSDLGEDARVAFYAKGRVLGSVLLTVAYDSAKQREDTELLGIIDPSAYYTVYADGANRRFDAASREKLYVRVESAAFYALYGDFETGFDQTRLAAYNRVATGVKGEVQLGQVHAQGFAAEIGSRYRRDEIQGAGISGPYQLSSRAIIANSETVTIEVRDRFRSEIIVERQTLTRFIDYDIDLLSGTISFTRPVLSRDSGLNPQFIVIDYEIDELAGGEWNAGLRADWTTDDGQLRFGATAITDKGDEERSDLLAADMRLRLGNATEIRAEVAASRSEGDTATAWMIEAEHHGSAMDLLAYAHQVGSSFGVGQLNGAERGRRKAGVDARYAVTEHWSVTASGWYENSLVDDASRRAVELRTDYRGERTDGFVGIAWFDDHLADGDRNSSTVLETGASQRLFDNRLEITGTTSIALDSTESIDLPTRHQLGLRYAITSDIRALATYEIAEGEAIDARTLRAGLEVSPWNGSKVIGTLGRQGLDDDRQRTFAAFGLAQSLPVTDSITIEATLDGNRTIGGFDPGDIVNPDHPIASGGFVGSGATLTEDFTAATLGATYRRDRWSATGRAEWRDGEFADRKGLSLAAIRQLGEGSVVGSGLTWTHASAPDGTSTEIIDAAIAAAHRPADSEFAFLSKLEFRSDSVRGAVFGEPGPVGGTALTVDGDAKSRRLIGSVSTNWTPRGGGAAGEILQRSEFALFVGGRYSFDEYEGYALDGFTALVGADVRIGIDERVEIGASATVRSNLTDGATSFSIGPQIGFAPVDNVLLTVGYNVTGFRDRDFRDARSTERGLFANIKMKFDTQSFSFLGLGR
ncbi:hypothetical protein [Alteraurantiacibacter aquimixticola]|uniref:hypothetical protein n=1 Tax=Alteraurantiacibacter aquimixticola TaxID=2489173 RepID=UPI001FE58DFB|nr:hypothetical protein [Alteraurantiacibacter aquimixticola]